MSEDNTGKKKKKKACGIRPKNKEHWRIGAEGKKGLKKKVVKNKKVVIG